MNECRLLDIDQFCAYIGLGKTKAREIMHKGLGEFTVKIGSRRYIDKEKFDKYLDRCIKYKITI